MENCRNVSAVEISRTPTPSPGYSCSASQRESTLPPKPSTPKRHALGPPCQLLLCPWTTLSHIPPLLQSNSCSSRLHVALLVGGHKEVVSDPSIKAKLFKDQWARKRDQGSASLLRGVFTYFMHWRFHLQNSRSALSKPGTMDLFWQGQLWLPGDPSRALCYSGCD